MLGMITKAPEGSAESITPLRSKRRVGMLLVIAFLVCLAVVVLVWCLSKRETGWDPFWHNNDAIF
jgi:hypothetical protein